eukprot:TRINITY_DN5573_c0_g1_i2.p1 TRINITY_DN5573_c0_g1~~TRINITY_DN5573_c0_g1_i2.p1  ORF type:complete len:427 (+),score=27.67 TRINITY_DN5573_c0_g1_i2:87-1367(+)
MSIWGVLILMLAVLLTSPGMLLLYVEKSTLVMTRAIVTRARAATSEVDCAAFGQMSGLVHITNCIVTGFTVYPTNSTPLLEGLRENFPQGGVRASWLEIQVESVSAERKMEFNSQPRIYSNASVGDYSLSPSLLDQLPSDWVHFRKSANKSFLGSHILGVSPTDDTVLDSYGGEAAEEGDISVSVLAGDAPARLSVFGDLHDGELRAFPGDSGEGELGLLSEGSVDLETMLNDYMNNRITVSRLCSVLVAILLAFPVSMILFVSCGNAESTDCVQGACGQMPRGLSACSLVMSLVDAFFEFESIRSAIVAFVGIGLALVAGCIAFLYWTREPIDSAGTQGLTLLTGSHDGPNTTPAIDDSVEYVASTPSPYSGVESISALLSSIFHKTSWKRIRRYVKPVIGGVTTALILYSVFAVICFWVGPFKM